MTLKLLLHIIMKCAVSNIEYMNLIGKFMIRANQCVIHVNSCQSSVAASAIPVFGLTR